MSEFPYYISEHGGELCDERAGVLDEHEILAALRAQFDALEAKAAEIERLRKAHNGEVCVDVQEYCEKLEATNRALREKLAEVENTNRSLRRKRHHLRDALRDVGHDALGALRELDADGGEAEGEG